jgi:hypothetical protein
MGLALTQHSGLIGFKFSLDNQTRLPLIVIKPETSTRFREGDGD